jgi:hypothetical protein
VDLGDRLAESHGFFEFVPGFLPLAEEDEGDAEVVVKVVVVGAELDGLLEMDTRLGVVTVGPLEDTVEVEDIRIMRALGEQLWAKRTGVVDVEAGNQGSEEEEFDVLVAGVVNEGLAEELDGVVIAELATKHCSECFGEKRRFWIGLEAFFEHLVGLFGVIEKAIGTGEVDGELFGPRSGIEERDDTTVVFAGEEVSAEAFECRRGSGIDGESLFPLLFAFVILAGAVKEFGKNEVRLDDFGIEAGGLLELFDGVGLMAGPEKGKASEEVELCGRGVTLESGLEDVNGATELVAAGVPTAEEDGAIRGGMRGETGDKLLRAGAGGFGGCCGWCSEGGDGDTCADGQQSPGFYRSNEGRH